MLKIECAHHYASVLCTFFLEGCFVAVVCMQIAEHYNKSPPPPPPLSLSLSLSPSLSRSPSHQLRSSLSLSLPLTLSFTPAHFFSGIRSFRDCVSWVVGKVHQIALLSSPPLFLTLCLTLWVSSLGLGKSRPIFQGLALRKPAFSVQNLHFTDLLDPLADCTTKEASGWSLRLKVPQNSRGAGRIFHAFE